MGELRIRLDGILAFLETSHRSDDRSHHGDEPLGLAASRLEAEVVGVGVEPRQHRHGSAQRRHCVFPGSVANPLEHRFRNAPLRGELPSELVELVFARQRPVPQQKDGFLEARVLGQVVNAVTAIDEVALFAVHLRHGRRGDDDPFQTACNLGHVDLRPQRTENDTSRWTVTPQSVGAPVDGAGRVDAANRRSL